MIRRALAVAAALGLLLGTTACGLSTDAEPRAIAPTELPPGLLGPTTSSTVSTSTPTAETVTIYYLVQRDGVTKLHPVARDVTDGDRPRDRLAALLDPPTADEQAAGVLSSVPSDTLLLNTQLVEADDELVVDLSRSLFDVQGQELRNAFAQLVWTATELDGVRRVRFLVEGEEFRVPDEEGVEQSGAVTRSDYITLAPG